MPVPHTPTAGEFFKRRECPASDTLLDYARRALPALRRQAVRLHLAKCDFCGAELQLLSTHRPEEEAPRATARIPLSLLLLAERSLPRRHVLKKSQRQHAA